MSAAPIPGSVLVFDSGLGGLTVLREIEKARPDLPLNYVADDAAFPYGRLADHALTARVVAVIGHYITRLTPRMVVIACNTASTLALPSLREKFATPFVGTVPAIKPACAQSHSKRISVLGTPGTVARDYTKALIKEFAHDCKVTLVGAENLATLAEASMRGEAVDDMAIVREFSPCFVEEGARTDTVVLACTHYPLILDRLTRLSPWPVHFIDPAPAIARRVSELAGLPGDGPPESGRAYFTSGREPGPDLVAALAAFGLAPAHSEAFLPV
jgi:glutamate racemase